MGGTVHSIFKIILLKLFLISSLYAAPRFLTISDIHYGIGNTANDGEDTGITLLKTAMHQFKKLSKSVDFILCLGDLPTHSLVMGQRQKGEYEKTVFASLYANDSDLKPMFYIAGNNDSLLGNYQPFAAKDISPLNFAIHWNGACIHCKKLILDGSHMHHDGYYSSYVIPGNKKIILIALNATQWTKTPFFVKQYPNQEGDALEQLSWLEKQLRSHHAQQLLIAMHEPPGNSYQGKPIWHKRYLKKFITLLNQNKQNYGEITLLTSHTHMDEVRKIQLDQYSTVYAYSVPSISRIHHNYPGMKVFTMNKKMQIENFTTYYTSKSDQWKSQNYQALNSPHAIWPDCKKPVLAQCLNQLSTQQVCHDLDKGLFYGVKSPTVLNNACNKIYEVNKNPKLTNN